MIHASTAFPSHWVPLLEAALVLAGMALALAGWRPLDRLGGALSRVTRRLALHPVRNLGVLAVTVFLAAALATALLGPPPPRVVDEQSYLLAADTFAHGRLTNPPHQLWRHFEAPHVLQHPTYASKYPPAQGALLALGRRLGGAEVVGLWLGAALLVAASAWMLLAWVPARWALLGAALVALRLGLGSYWNQSYWGGSVAAIGGLLLFGAVRRLSRRVRLRDTLAMAAGLALLANSRPFEGLLVAFPCALLLGVGLVRRRLRPHPYVALVVPIGILLLALAFGMAFYDRAVTGYWAELPHQLYDQVHGEVPVFAWQQAGTDGLPTGAFGWRLPRSSGWQRLAISSSFLVGLPMLLALFVGDRVVRDPWSRFGAGCYLLVVAGHFVTYPWWPHYDGPALAALLVPTMVGQRQLYVLRRRSRRIGRSLLAAAWVVQIACFAVQIPAHRPDATDPSRQRARLARHFESLPGLHVVLVSYAADRSADWTYNDADIDAAKVVWATDLGEEGNRDLIAYYPDRTIWQVEARFTATDPEPRLLRRAVSPEPASPVP